MRRNFRRRLVAGCAALASVSFGAVAAGTGIPSAVAAPAAAPGVTATTVTIGTVADIGGPVPGLFQGAINAVQAYAAYINSKGGVDGRKLVVKTADTALSCPQSQSAVQGLSSSVFAFVGSFANYDNCEVPAFKAVPDLVNVGYALTGAFKSMPNEYSPQPSPPGFYVGPFKYLASRYPAAVKHMGTLVGQSAGSLQNWAYQKAALQSVGYHVSYVRIVPPTDVTFTSDIIRMKQLGVQFLLVIDEDAATTARILNAAAQQGWRPKVVDAPVAYDLNFPKIIQGNAAANIYASQVYSLYLGQDAKRIPEVKLMNTWLTKTHPGTLTNVETMYGWASAALFVQALKAAGHNPTRAGLLAALKRIHNFGDNGLMASSDVGRKKPPSCWLVAQYVHNTWVRTTPTNSRYRCSPTGYYYAK